MASYGNASGPVPPVELGMLAAKGSLFLTRPTLATYTAKRSDLERVAADLFDVVGSGAVKIQVNQTFSLKDAGAAHTALETRKTTGSTVLLPIGHDCARFSAKPIARRMNTRFIGCMRFTASIPTSRTTRMRRRSVLNSRSIPSVIANIRRLSACRTR